MVRNYKDRRRCYINQKRYLDKRYLFIEIFVSIIISFLFLYFIDYRLNTVLENYIDSEVDKVTSSMIHYALKKVSSSNHEDYLFVKDNNISYNTKEINRVREEVEDAIEEEFKLVESGMFEHYQFAHQEKYQKKYSHMKSGYLCEVSLHSLEGSVIFGNLGPMIPIKLSFMGSINTDIDVKVEEYGINNVLLEVDIIIKVSNLITMPISSRVHDVEVKDVLSVEVIPGEVPNYYFR